MTRWEPGGRERLQHAAMALFQERGYEAVTIAEIAESAGLTRRSFFNHFSDKREVPFAGAGALVAEVAERLRRAPRDLAPFDAAVDALAGAGARLADTIPFAAMRRELIASSADLRERDLVKTAELIDAVAGVLGDRGAAHRRAELTAQAAVAVFTAAYDDWADDRTADFPALMARAADEMLLAVRGEQDAGVAIPVYNS